MHFVLGKGGVGKSTVAAALALGLARGGARVLAIELDRPDGLGRALRARTDAPGAITLTPAGVAYSYFDGAAALAEYLQRKARLGPLLHGVFAHPLYAAFVGAAPGVKELLAIGKVRDELVLQKVHGRPRWDAVVVDAGASGHALEVLRMPKSAASTFASGRVHREAARIHELISDGSRSAIHVLATAEEMPVAEAAQSVGTLEAEIGLPVGRLIVNRCIEPAPAGIERTLRRLVELSVMGERERAAREALLASGRRALGWAAIQERAIDALRLATRREPLRLPLLTASPLGLAELRVLADRLREGVA